MPGETPPAAVPGAQPAAVVPAPAGPAATPPAPQENMVPQSAMDRVTRERWDATRRADESDRALAAANEIIAELRRVAGGTPAASPPVPAAPSADPPGTRKVTPDELRRLVGEQSATQEFNRRCNESVGLGKAAHTDFEQVVMGTLAGLSPVYDAVTNRPMLPQLLIEAALETGEAHEVLYALGKDTVNASRIMGLPPIRQAVEIAKFHEKLVAARPPKEGEDNKNEDNDNEEAAAPPNTSRAPAPPRTQAGRGNNPSRPAFDMMDTSKSSTSDWIAKRQADVDAKRKNGTYRGR